MAESEKTELNHMEPQVHTAHLLFESWIMGNVYEFALNNSKHIKIENETGY